jgi:hypothetical protein
VGACLSHLDVADADRKARAKGGVHREVAHDQPMHVRRLERRLVRPSAARHDPHLLRLAGMDDLARALEVTVRYRVEAAAEHRDARVARRRAIVQRERLLRAGASLRQLLHRRCRHSRHHREQEAVTDVTTYMYNPQHCKARILFARTP